MSRTKDLLRLCSIPVMFPKACERLFHRDGYIILDGALLWSL